jgi:hypothetical protein
MKPRPIDAGFDPNNPTPPFQRWVKNLQRYLYQQQTERKFGQRKPKVPDLIALKHKNDPFYIGGPAPEKLGRWFAALYRRLDLGNGVHLRRIHYRCLDLADFTKVDGMSYTNSKRDWYTLEIAAKYARVLRLVPADEFEDRRNPEAITPAWIENLDLGIRPHIIPPNVQSFSMPKITLDDLILPEVGEPFATGYGHDDFADRPVYCELWVEKTTMNDVLAPLCEELGVALVPAAGIQSITASVNMLLRLQRLRKPGRVFYISDYDPAGKTMPISVARHLEFWKRYYAPESQVCLQPLVLTREQVAKYKLPKNVIGGRSKAIWEASEGKGVVELDALEGRKAGELARIVRAALAPYHDSTLSRRLREASAEAARIVDEEWDGQTTELEEELDELGETVEQIVEKYQPKVEALSEKLEKELRPHRERMASLQAELSEAAQGLHVELPDRPAPKIEVDESDWLFNSSRTYLEQNEFYQKRKKGKAAKRGRR